MGADDKMRANEFILEAKQAEPDVYEMFTEQDIKRIASSVFRKVYPKNKLYSDEDDFVYLSTSKSPMVVTQWGERSNSWDDEEDYNTDHYYLAVNVSIANGELCVVIGNATAGAFKGVTSLIIQALFNAGIRMWGIPTKKELVIVSDSSGGKWEEIASKLGVEYSEQ